MSKGSAPSELPVARLVAEESAFAHRGLRMQFERIEAALSGGDLQRSARLLGELIGQAREHFTHEESIALGAGYSSNAGGRLLHDAFVERAGNLKARCLNSPDNGYYRQVIGQELVLLLSDLVEHDLRIQRSFSNTNGAE